MLICIIGLADTMDENSIAFISTTSQSIQLFTKEHKKSREQFQYKLAPTIDERETS